MTQKDKILKLLRTNKWIKVQSMHKIAWRYGSILFNLRKEGFVLQKRRQKNSNLEEWKLITKAPKKSIDIRTILGNYFKK